LIENMRIAYIAPYQGPALMQRRPTLQNLALAGNVKIELIAELLQRHRHEVEILSQGEVVENSAKFYPPFSESNHFNASIPVLYASAFPVRFVNGLWSTGRLLALFKQRHQAAPFDVVIVYNLKMPQVGCARYAVKSLNLPVVLEYEDDSFVDIGGRRETGFRARWQLSRAQQVLDSAAGCIGVSPYLMSRFPETIPKLLLRGVVSQEILNVHGSPPEKKNWVAYSGTFTQSKGLVPLIKAWRAVDLPGWELHIAGDGKSAGDLHRLAENCPSIVFRGRLDREQNARFLSEARIGINPHDLSATPGNVFAFKIIEYLAAGAHVISTPMGALEPEIERGITYMADNSPESIAATLKRVIDERLFDREASQAALDAYGPAAVAGSLNNLLNEVIAARRNRHSSSVARVNANA
jgi:glycosyltransferase involved in cell wall biosynthesis